MTSTGKRGVCKLWMVERGVPIKLRSSAADSSEDFPPTVPDSIWQVSKFNILDFDSLHTWFKVENSRA